MRVLLVNNLGYQRSGAEVVVKTLKVELTKLGHDARVLAGSGDEHSPSYFADYTFKSFSEHTPLRFVLYLLNPLALIKFWKVLREFQPDIVHIHNYSKLSPLALLLASKFPTILTVHDFTAFDPTAIERLPHFKQYRQEMGGYFTDKKDIRYLGEKLRFSMIRHFSRRVSTIITCSDFFAKEMHASGDYSNVSVIHNGTTIQPLSSPPNNKQLAYVGRVEEEKGIGMILDAMKIVSQKIPDVQLIVAGTGNSLALYKSLAASEGLANNVTFVGHKSRRSVLNLIKASQVVLVPSLFPDNLPTTCLEAMAAGRPLIATDIGGIPEMIIDGKTGYLIEPGDVKALADRILKLLENPLTARAFGQAARRQAIAEFSEQQYVSRTIARYNELIS